MTLVYPDIQPVKRQSLANDVADRLRQLIATGVLPPGTHLLEVELAYQLGVSRGPLREALRLLESEGIVQSFLGRGTYVASMSEEDIVEVYSLRSILEQEAARRAAIKATSAQVDCLDIILQDLFTAAGGNDLIQVIELDLEFHRQIWKMSGHRRLLQVLESISSQVKLYLSVQTKLYSDLASGIADHKEILEAIRKKDSQKAAFLMRQHLNSAEQVVQEYAHEQAKIGIQS